MRKKISILALIEISLMAGIAMAKGVVEVSIVEELTEAINKGKPRIIKFTDDITVKTELGSFNNTKSDSIIIDGNKHSLNGNQQSFGSLTGSFEMKNFGNGVSILEKVSTSSDKFVRFIDSEKRVKNVVVDKSFNNFQVRAITLIAGALNVSNSVFYQNTGELLSLDNKSILNIYDSFFVGNGNAGVKPSDHGIIYSLNEGAFGGNLNIIDSTFIGNKDDSPYFIEGKSLKVKIKAEKKDTVFYGNNRSKMYKANLEAKAGHKILISDEFSGEDIIYVNQEQGSVGGIIFDGSLTADCFCVHNGTNNFNSLVTTNYAFEVYGGTNVFNLPVTINEFFGIFYLYGGNNTFNDLTETRYYFEVNNGTNNFNGQLKANYFLYSYGGHNIFSDKIASKYLYLYCNTTFNDEVKASTINLFENATVSFNQGPVSANLINLEAGSSLTARAGFNCKEINTTGGTIDLHNEAGFLDDLNFRDINLEKNLSLALEVNMNERKMSAIFVQNTPQFNDHYIVISQLHFANLLDTNISQKNSYYPNASPLYPMMLYDEKVELDILKKNGEMAEKTEQDILARIKYTGGDTLLEMYGIEYSNGRFTITPNFINVYTAEELTEALSKKNPRLIKFANDITVEAELGNFTNEQQSIVIDGNGYGLNGNQQPFGVLKGSFEMINFGRVNIVEAVPNDTSKIVSFTDIDGKVKYVVLDKSFNDFKTKTLTLSNGSLKIFSSVFYQNVGTLLNVDSESSLDVYGSFFIANGNILTIEGKNPITFKNCTLIGNVGPKTEPSSLIYSSYSSSDKLDNQVLNIIDSTFIGNKDTSYFLEGKSLSVKIRAENKDTIFYNNKLSKVHMFDLDAKMGHKIFINDDFSVKYTILVNQEEESLGEIKFAGGITFEGPITFDYFRVYKGFNNFTGLVTTNHAFEKNNNDQVISYDDFRSAYVDGGTNIFASLFSADSFEVGGTNTFNHQVIINETLFLGGESNTFNAPVTAKNLTANGRVNIFNDQVTVTDTLSIEEGSNVFNGPVTVSDMKLHQSVTFNNEVEAREIHLVGITQVFRFPVSMDLLELTEGSLMVRSTFNCKKINTAGGFIDLNSGTDVLNALNFGKINLNHDLLLYLNVDLVKGEINPISVKGSLEDNGHYINISRLYPTNLLKEKVEIDIFKERNVIAKGTKQEILPRIKYMGENSLLGLYEVEYNNGCFTINPNDDDLNRSFSMITVIETQIGDVFAQLNSFRAVFQQIGFFMNQETSNLVLEKKPKVTNSNKRASAEENKRAFAEEMLDEELVAQGSLNFKDQDKRGWISSAMSTEKVPFLHGVKIKHSTYSTHCGINSKISHLENGWGFEYGIYGGYRGSRLIYDSIEGEAKITQNGGTLGAVGVAYRNDFFTGVTINGGGSRNGSSTKHGTDNTLAFMLGIANKTGYNLRYKEVIIQPSLFFSYAVIDAKNYTNSTGLAIKSRPLHALHLEPELKVLGNLKSCAPYLNLSMVFNLLNTHRVWAGDLLLVNPKIKPYMRYGLGLEKDFSSRFAFFLQGEYTSGGRNGFTLRVGGKISLL